ncbi:MAG: hypothetical protein OEZ13_02535 [Spirochaetia bacterium]|nr:hypothetical protein [Spirochaetia bacterium]
MRFLSINKIFYAGFLLFFILNTKNLQAYSNYSSNNTLFFNETIFFQNNNSSYANALSLELTPVFSLNKVLDSHKDESSFRRAEIIFFLSFPFVLAAHGILAAGLYYSATQDASFNLPRPLITFSFVSSAMISTAISYYDYKTIQTKKSARFLFNKRF